MIFKTLLHAPEKFLFALDKDELDFIAKRFEISLEVTNYFALTK